MENKNSENIHVPKKKTVSSQEKKTIHILYKKNGSIHLQKSSYYNYMHASKNYSNNLQLLTRQVKMNIASFNCLANVTYTKKKIVLKFLVHSNNNTNSRNDACVLSKAYMCTIC